MELQKKANKALIESRIKRAASYGKSKKNSKIEGDGSSVQDDSDNEKDKDSSSDYSSSDASDDSGLGNDLVEDAQATQKYEDDFLIKDKFYDYKYCVSKDESIAVSAQLKKETNMRKLQFILNEIINDLGFRKGTLW